MTQHRHAVLTVLAVVLLLAGLVTLLAGLVIVGRWENDRAVQREVEGMRSVLALVGTTLDTRLLSGYRTSEELACLTYRTGKDEPFGLELCFAPSGRLVETIDRRGGDVRFASLRAQRDASPIRYDVGVILAVLRRAAPKIFTLDVTSLPTGRDVGVITLEPSSSATFARSRG